MLLYILYYFIYFTYHYSIMYGYYRSVSQFYYRLKSKLLFCFFDVVFGRKLNRFVFGERRREVLLAKCCVCFSSSFKCCSLLIIPYGRLDFDVNHLSKCYTKNFLFYSEIFSVLNLWKSVKVLWMFNVLIKIRKLQLVVLLLENYTVWNVYIIYLIA